MVCKCRHCTVGRHDLSILLAIKDSKQLHLHLTGVTVPSDHMCLSLMDRPFQLAPVPIGERDPPRHTYCVRNVGAAELPFVIDIAPLQQLVKLKYGYEVKSPQPVNVITTLLFVLSLAVCVWHTTSFCFLFLKSKASSTASLAASAEHIARTSKETVIASGIAAGSQAAGSTSGQSWSLRCCWPQFTLSPNEARVHNATPPIRPTQAPESSLS